MLKEIITSSILSIGIAIQPAALQVLQGQNEFAGYGNAYSEEEYNIDDTLERQLTYRTLNYKPALYGGNTQTNARVIQRIDRNIVEDEYIIRTLCVFKLNNPTNMDIHNLRTAFQGNPQYVDLLETNHWTLYYYQTPTQAIIDFLNYANYNNYTEIENIYYTINSNTTYIDNLGEYNANGYTYYYKDNQTNVDQTYYMVETLYNFDPTKITDTGGFMLAVKPYNTIIQNVSYLPGEQTGEIVDIPGMMFEILGMPFAWLSTAFNFTIYPGTPYEINISALLMAIVLSLIVLYIIKKIIK